MGSNPAARRGGPATALPAPTGGKELLLDSPASKCVLSHPDSKSRRPPSSDCRPRNSTGSCSAKTLPGSARGLLPPVGILTLPRRRRQDTTAARGPCHARSRGCVRLLPCQASRQVRNAPSNECGDDRLETRCRATSTCLWVAATTPPIPPRRRHQAVRGGTQPPHACRDSRSARHPTALRNTPNGALENRKGRQAPGGSNPSPSAKSPSATPPSAKALRMGKLRGCGHRFLLPGGHSSR